MPIHDSQDRIEFEKTFIKEVPDAHSLLERRKDGEYRWVGPQWAWKAWQWRGRGIVWSNMPPKTGDAA